MSKTALEIEIDTAHNGNAVFRPLERSIRGRFSFDRAAQGEKNWHLESAGCPDVIPGQRIGFDAGEGYVLEPLHAPEHERIAERVKRQGMKLAEAAKVGRFVIFHHDPGHDDLFMDKIAAEAERLRPGTVVAREGMLLSI